MTRILISAGHSNTDPGAISGSIKESEVAVEMRNLVAARLKNMGVYDIITDGTGSDNKTLKEAIRLAKESKLAIEFHCNSVVDARANGVESIALSDKKELAQRLSACVSSVLGFKLRGEGGYIDQSKSQHKKLGFVQDGNGIIVELVFLSNPIELAKFQTMKLLLANTLAGVITNAV